MIQYKLLKDNLIWQGVWSELRAFIQSWRKELKLSLADSVDVAFRVAADNTVQAYLTVPNTGCDSRSVNLDKMCIQPLSPENYWRVIASGLDFLGENALLHSVRATNESTGEEVFWQRNF